MDDVLAGSLREAVYERLGYLDRLAAQVGPDSRAGAELARLTAGWRAVLRGHDPDEHGHCPACSAWRRPVAHPCTTWTAAHRHLLAGEHPPPAIGRHRIGR